MESITSNRTVFFADILGFSHFATTTANAQRAVDALSDVAAIFGDPNKILSYLQRPTWKERFSLSDSVFLVSDDPIEACRAAVDLFFALAYLNVTHPEEACLIRGAITMGGVRSISDPIFPESATRNLVGEAVVRAVRLEESEFFKGPRLFVDNGIAALIGCLDRADPLRNLLYTLGTECSELLWILPACGTPKALMIGEVAKDAVTLFLNHASDPKVVLHYLAYLDLVTRGLERLQPADVQVAIREADLDRACPCLQGLLAGKAVPELILFERIQTLLSS